MAQLMVGDPAPEFTLPDADNAPVSLSDFAGRRVVVYFYPAALTPGCTTQAVDFTAARESLDAAGLTVLGISPDAPEKLAKFRDKYDLSVRPVSYTHLDVYKRQLPQRVEDTSWDQLAAQLREAFDRLEHERGEAGGEYRNPAAALRNNTTIDDFLMSVFDLSWLEVRFGLTGDGLPLSQLSPGQRGLVLALFYLVVDRRTTPLLLDQPEENLDNETIASKLVPAIHEAAGRRQTIVVTHNANLAIVGDADQIVHCQMNDRRFTVNSGSICLLYTSRCV